VRTLHPAEFDDYIERVIADRQRHFVEARKVTASILPDFAQKLETTKLTSGNF